MGAGLRGNQPWRPWSNLRRHSTPKDAAQFGELWRHRRGDLRGVPTDPSGLLGATGGNPAPMTNLKSEGKRSVIGALRLG